ncbi:hypothetical protein RB195_010059 [Necator americanus]|uniref:Uncharacterized protein n=1 Tax=Necator americanus TaxID=51031 RepID=A0ABR1CZI0_NECAM
MGRVDELIRNNEGTESQRSYYLHVRESPLNLLKAKGLDFEETKENPEPMSHQQTPKRSSETAQETTVDDQSIGKEPSHYNLRQTRRLGNSTLTLNLDTVLVISVTVLRFFMY